jgi:phosphoribosylformylglycinamidine synthase
MNPYYGDFDTYHMAASAIDEAIRNCVAVGADPSRIAILDNFSWGHTDRASTLGSLVRAALACHDYSVAFQTPFISGKDSLHNEFSYTDEQSVRKTISIPATLLITAMGQVADVKRCVSMDFKQAGNWIFLVGQTGDHLGGSHWSLVRSATGGSVPTVDAVRAKQIFVALHKAIQAGYVRACHDLSEGGLAVALAEMAFAGGVGAEVSLSSLPRLTVRVQQNSQFAELPNSAVQLFSESNSRFLVEIPDTIRAEFETAMLDIPLYCIGQVTEHSNLNITVGEESLIDLPISKLKQAWQSPLDWS